MHEFEIRLSHFLPNIMYSVVPFFNLLKDLNGQHLYSFQTQNKTFKGMNFNINLRDWFAYLISIFKFLKYFSNLSLAMARDFLLVLIQEWQISRYGTVFEEPLVISDFIQNTKSGFERTDKVFLISK